MNGSYTSLQQIREDFQIAEEDPETIRTRLRMKQSSIHPDRTGGSFASKEDETLFHRLGIAIEFLDNRDKYGALVSVSAVTDLTKAVTELIKAQSSVPDNTLSEKIKDQIQSYRSRFALPKITISAITVALTAVWIFPNTVKDHPILGKWFDPSSSLFGIAWIYVLLSTVAFWLLVWRNEERQREFQESLKTEMVQNRIFRDFLRHFEKNKFSIEDLVDFIIDRHPRSYHFLPPFSLIGNPREISISTAHTIAEVIIKRALSRQAIKKESIGQISETYTIAVENDPDLQRNERDGHFGA